MIIVNSWSAEEKCSFLTRRASSLILALLAAALEVAERCTPAGIGKRLDRRVGVFRRMMDLRDVVNGGDAGIELAERAEQDRDVDILRPIDRGEFAQDEIEIVNGSVRIAVVEQNAVGKEAAQRGLELVMMRIDEARHDDHAF